MNKYYFYIQYYAKKIVSLFFSIIKNGYECEICGKKIYKSILCKDCFEKNFLQKIKFIKPLTCLQDNQFINSFDKVVCLFPYDLWNKNLLFKWKIAGERCLSLDFSKMIYFALKKFQIETIVPVPPRPGKIKEKGWDQIDELCNYLEFFFNIKILRILERKSKLQMKKLNRNERLQLSNGSYGLKSSKQIDQELKRRKIIFPEKICLLDDVMTTGATLESCCICLKKGGVKEVSAITLFNV